MGSTGRVGGAVDWGRNSSAYYRYTEKRPPREHLLVTLQHVEREGRPRARPTAIDLGFGAGTDTLELLRRGWRVLALDGQESAAKFLDRRVPPSHRESLSILVAPMEEVVLPSADLIYASFSLPFCPPGRFSRLWKSIRRAVRPGGHFSGQMFGVHDSWRTDRSMSFFDRDQVRKLARGFRIELLRETEEDGVAFSGPKHWHYFDLILEKPRASV